MSFPALVGIAGQAGSGKDTLAEYLQIVYGCHRYAIADYREADRNEISK
jgi:dephospho-CoA kinase